MERVFKIQYEDDLRKLKHTIDTLESFENKVAEVFKLSGKPFSLKYLDGEGDWISVTSDLDLIEAFNFIDTEHVPKFKITLSAPAPTTSTPVGTTSTNNNIPQM